MNKQAKIYVGILGGLLVVTVIGHFSADVYNVSAVYHNAEYRFTMRYPNSWEIIDTAALMRDSSSRLDIDEIEGTPPVVFLAGPDRGEILRPSVIVSVLPLKPGQGIGQAMLADFLSGIDEAGSNFGMMSQSIEVLAGHEAMHASYKLRVARHAKPYYVRYDTYLVPYARQLYAITCTSTLLNFSRHEPVFRKIFDSFAFVES